MNNNTTTTIKNTKESLLNEVITYICNTFNVELQEVIQNTRFYTKELLRSVRSNNYQLAYLRRKRRELNEDIRDLESTYVSGDSYDNPVLGKNTGARPNNVEIKHLKVLELKEKLRNMVIESELLDQSLAEHNKLISRFIELLSTDGCIIIMKMTYVDCLPNTEIANTLMFSVNNIDIARSRGLTRLSNILKEYLKKNKSV